ncbi:unnamed protein product [Trichogramma brassicae]|uniref:Uncharacterized protein n=1 Tax=Trichogramma brassicae TaxID=86971 RepID=A0A6H5HW79_9HYME|nr:unnamed protein product [Trichogramma brassicae]
MQTRVAWLDNLPAVMLGLRTRPILGTDMRPAEMLYGRALRIPGIFCNYEDDDTDTSEFKKSFLRFMMDLKPLQVEHKCNTKPFYFKDLDTCSHVLKLIKVIQPSLCPPYSGPHYVEGRDDDRKHFDININGEIVKVSTDQLKPAYFLGDEEGGVGVDDLLTDSQQRAATPSMLAAGHFVLEDDVSITALNNQVVLDSQQVPLKRNLQVASDSQRSPLRGNPQVPLQRNSQALPTRWVMPEVLALLADCVASLEVPGGEGLTVGVMMKSEASYWLEGRRAQSVVSLARQETLVVFGFVVENEEPLESRSVFSPFDTSEVELADSHGDMVTESEPVVGELWAVVAPVTRLEERELTARRAQAEFGASDMRAHLDGNDTVHCSAGPQLLNVYAREVIVRPRSMCQSPNSVVWQRSSQRKPSPRSSVIREARMGWRDRQLRNSSRVPDPDRRQTASAAGRSGLHSPSDRSRMAEARSGCYLSTGGHT